MTGPDHFKEAIVDIALLAAMGDSDRAHSAEDALYRDVLQAIADGATNAAELAAEALKTRELDFSRWCA